MPITPRVPLTLDLAIAFAASIGGIVLTVLSRNVRVKRIVLPITLVIFHAMVLVIIRRSGALAQVPSVVLIALLALNATYVFRVIGYCATCGRTVQSSLMRREVIRCSECSAG